MKNIVLLIIVLFSTSTLSANDGMSFNEFAEKIRKYFDDRLISDVEKALPPEKNYQIWGWDVGDFSGDGYYDVAFSLRSYKDKGRNLRVFMFADVEGYLTKVAEFPYSFYEIPLEVGIVIKQNTCYITQKHKQFNWTILGYTYDSGVLIKVDEFNTEREGKVTKESYRNFLTLRNNEKYLETKSGETKFKIEFLTLPSYIRGKKIYKGYTEELHSYSVDYVNKGAFDWKGAEDASFKIKSNYDDKFVYFTVEIIDDLVIGDECEDCYKDYLDLWIDNKPLESSEKFQFYKRRIEVNKSELSNYFKYSIYPGDFKNKKPYIKIHTVENENPELERASKDIKVASKLTDYGYNLKFKVPIKLFNLNDYDRNKTVEIPCSIVVHDIDNQFRPEEESEIASSDFNSSNPKSYGTLLFLPPDEFYGKCDYLYKDKIINHLHQYGY